MAGTALGFNLEGSLAAIEKWVHDMSSDEEEECDENGEEEEEEPLVPLELNNDDTSSQRTARGARSGNDTTASDLTSTPWHSSLFVAAPARSANVSSSSSSTSTPTQESPNSRPTAGTSAFTIGSATGSLSGSASKEKILDRNAIYDMVSGDS